MTAAIQPPVVEADPYALDPGAIEAPPRNLLKALRQIGPGLILAGAIVGTGELIATTHLGAKVGFALLWLVIVSCAVKVFVQLELGRYTISSGQTTFAAFRQIPGAGRIIAACWLLMMLCTQLQVGAMVGGVGQALHMAIPGVSPAAASAVRPASPALAAYVAAHPEMPWAILTAVVTSALLGIGGYRIIEKGSTFLVATFTLMTVGCVVLLPAASHPIDWSAVGHGLTFTIPSSKGAIAAAFAMLGITGVGATELVIYPYWCIEKGYARKTGPRDGSAQWLERARGWVRIMRLDAWVSMGVYTVATLAFYFLGAAVLHGRAAGGLPQTVGGMLSELSQMYRPVMGERLAVWFIVGGVFAVLYSTLYAATAGNARTLVDFLHTHCAMPFRGAHSRRNWVRMVCVAFPILDLLLFMRVGNPVKMVIWGGMAQAISLPMIGGAAVFLRYRRTDRRLVGGKAWDALLWVSVLALCAAATYVGVDALSR